MMEEVLSLESESMAMLESEASDTNIMEMLIKLNELSDVASAQDSGRSSLLSSLLLSLSIARMSSFHLCKIVIAVSLMFSSSSLRAEVRGMMVQCDCSILIHAAIDTL